MTVMRFVPITTIESTISQAFKAAKNTDCVLLFNRVPIDTLDKAANLFNLKNNSLQAIGHHGTGGDRDFSDGLKPKMTQTNN